VDQSQRGFIRKRNLSKPATLADSCPAEIAYKFADTTFRPPAAPLVEILGVKVAGHKIVDDDEYFFRVVEDGFFRYDQDIPVNREQGKWRMAR
jgi:hypothetical protein